MIEDGVIEVVVCNKPNTGMKALKILLIVLAVAGFFLSAASLIFLIVAVVCAILAYVVNGKIQIDYEYSLVDRELRVARIANKEKRKHLGTYDLDKMEILAPATSYHLDDFKRHKVDKDLDYSDHLKPEDHPQGRYILFLEDNTRIQLTLQGEEAQRLLDSIRQFAPRKVFRD